MTPRDKEETDPATSRSDPRQADPQDRSVASVFSERSNRYYEDNYALDAKTPNSFLKQHRKELILDLAGNQGGVALELGAGPAVLTQELADRGKSVVALDISLDMVLAGRARIRQGTQKISFCAARCQSLPFRSASFDQVFAAGVLEYLPDLEEGLAELSSVLKPGGQIIASFPVHRIWYEHVAKVAARWLPAIRRLLGSSRGGSSRNPRLRHSFPHYRFRPGRLRRRLRKAGWEVRVARYHHFVVFPLDVISSDLTLTLDRSLNNRLPGFARPLMAKSVVLLLQKNEST